jgi:hypothetical protein
MWTDLSDLLGRQSVRLPALLTPHPGKLRACQLALLRFRLIAQPQLLALSPSFVKSSGAGSN